MQAFSLLSSCTGQRFGVLLAPPFFPLDACSPLSLLRLLAPSLWPPTCFAWVVCSCRNVYHKYDNRLAALENKKWEDQKAKLSAAAAKQ